VGGWGCGDGISMIGNLRGGRILYSRKFWVGGEVDSMIGN